MSMDYTKDTSAIGSVLYRTNCAPWSVPGGPTGYRFSVTKTETVGAHLATTSLVTNWAVGEVQRPWASKPTNANYWVSQPKTEPYKPEAFPEVQTPARHDYAGYYGVPYRYQSYGYLGDGWVRFSYPNYYRGRSYRGGSYGDSRYGLVGGYGSGSYVGANFFGGIDIGSGLNYGGSYYRGSSYGSLGYGNPVSYGSRSYGSRHR